MPIALSVGPFHMAKFPASWNFADVLILAYSASCLDIAHSVHTRTHPLPQKSRVVGILQCMYPEGFKIEVAKIMDSFDCYLQDYIQSSLGTFFWAICIAPKHTPWE